MIEGEGSRSILERTVEFGLRNRLLAVLLFGVALLGGGWRLTQLSIDAFPDKTPVQVQVNTNAPALNPEEIEQQIALPVELAISGLPGPTNVRSVSKFGFSQAVATFDDNTNIYDARQFVMERLNGVELPADVERSQLGPISTGLGEIFHYVIRSTDPERTLTELRTLHDWVIKPALLTTPGVAEVNSWGGYEKEFHVVFDPSALVKYGLTLGEVEEALRRYNQNVGGGQLHRSGESLLVHGLGRVATTEEIGNMVIAAHEGAPIYVRDIGEVRIDYEIRRGAVTYQGEGEVVLGLGFMLMGENSKEVTEALRARLESVRSALPRDVQVELVYDRTELTANVIQTVRHNLIAGAVLVVVVLFLLLGNVRAGLIVALTIPAAMLFAALGMYELSIAASLLSLGAIDFGIIVDGSVVMTEAHLRRLREAEGEAERRLSADERLVEMARASREVVRPTVFGMGIIVLVFLPILALEGIEAKMFRPMAWTFIFALTGALLIAVFLTPILSYCLLPRKMGRVRRGLSEGLGYLYGGALKAALAMRWGVVAGAVALIAGGVMPARQLGANSSCG